MSEGPLVEAKQTPIISRWWGWRRPGQEEAGDVGATLAEVGFHCHCPRRACRAPEAPLGILTGAVRQLPARAALRARTGVLPPAGYSGKALCPGGSPLAAQEEAGNSPRAPAAPGHTRRSSWTHSA